MPVHVPVPVPAQCPMSARSTPGAVVLLRNPPQRCGFSHQLRAAAPAPTRLREGGALERDDKQVLFHNHWARNAGSTIEVPLCFRKGS